MKKIDLGKGEIGKCKNRHVEKCKNRHGKKKNSK
jgi:hypothetical protein